ncbi:MAG: T9SS type A sorting domain-containing protein [Bacteroidetes bacterium]|nr:T9SS type A sorting domain-containing protein [Bacteroidota bacterium]
MATPNGDTTNRLTISKTGAAATFAYRGSDINAGSFGTGVSTTAVGDEIEPILGVCASYTTISNINLYTHGTSPQTVEIGLAQFELFGNKGAQNNFYDKISIDLDRTKGDVYGIYSFSTTSPGGNPGTNSNNTWRDINIRDCNFGFALVGVNNATGPADFGNQIITSSCNTFNYIGDPNVPDDIISSSPSGILISGQYNFIIRNCIIQNITATSWYSTSGIGVTNSHGTNEISNNIIRTIRRSATGLFSNHWIAGIRINWPNQTMSFKVFNNSISNLLSSYTGVATTTAAVVGIFIESNTGTITTEIYNNSVSLNGSTFPNASSVCISMNSVSKTSQIRNNVFANFTGPQSGVAHHTCFYTNAASQYGNTGSLSDNNNFYIADTANGYIARATSTYFKTLAQWQAAMTVNPGTDANSQVANPNFVNNATDLHPTPASTSLDGTGTTPPAYITTDLDCRTRTAPHDIGCYWAGCWAEAGTVSPNAATVCAQQTYVMSATGYASYPGITYQWQRATVSGGPYSNVSGGSGAATTAYTTGKLTTGTYYYVLKVTCPSGLIDYSNELSITVNALPTNTITPAGPTTFCSGGSVVLNATVAANRSYQWQKGSAPIAAATLPSYTATAGGSYKVIITNTITGCSKATSTATVVTVNALPTATITPLGPISFCAGDSVILQANAGTGLTYKWKKGANYIAGATLQNYAAKTGGTYRVEVTNINGCTKSSAGVAITVPCKEGAFALTNEVFNFSAFPNPANEELNIEIAWDEIFEIEIVNTLGETVIKTHNQSNIDLSDLARGIYYIKVFNENHSAIQKLIKE